MTVPPAGRTPYATVHELLARGLREMAREVAETHLESSPNDPAALRLMAAAMEALGDFTAAGQLCEAALRLAPDDPEILGFSVGTWYRAGDYQRSLDCVSRLRARFPHAADVCLEQVRVVLRLSGPEAALEVMQAIPAGVDNIPLRRHVEGQIFIALNRDSEAEASLVEAAECAALSQDMRTFAWFEVAKVRDRGGNYEGAWAAATEGHRLAGKRFDVGGYEALLGSIQQVFDRRHLIQWAHATQPDDRHVFIVGMPRSGTTLLEQILSMHPAVANAGEVAVSTTMQRRLASLTDSFLPWPKSIADLQERDADVLQGMYQGAVAEVGAGKQRITNKALVLQHHLGMLSLSLPGSYSIMLHRHPLDNMVSCYTTDLVGSGHHYCSDLEVLARVWVARRKMQDFWSENLEKAPLQLHYERLVDDQEAQTRALLSHLDLPWEEACLSFHKSTRKVATISHDQVTRKLYRSSKGRWQNYEKYLGPAAKIVEKYL